MQLICLVVMCIASCFFVFIFVHNFSVWKLSLTVTLLRQLVVHMQGISEVDVVE